MKAVRVERASSVQRQLWLLEERMADGSAYHVPSLYRIDGPLDVQALQRSFCDIVQRHEVLRSGFSLEGSDVVQRVFSDRPPEFSADGLVSD